MLELHVANNDVTGGNISVGWCVDKETLDLLAKMKVKNPVMVLVTAPAGEAYDAKKESRTVVPLNDLIAYVDFHSHGENNIWGFIASDLRSTKNFFLSRSHRGGYEYEALNYSGDAIRASTLLWFGDEGRGQDAKPFCAPVVTVAVPKGCFAPEPAQWEKDWVNHILTYKSIDQCAFRRKRLFAYTIQPVLMFFNMMLRLLFTIVGLLIGARGLSPKYLCHPLTYDLDDSLHVFKGGTFFIGRGDNKVLNWLRLPFIPLIMLPLLFITYLGHMPLVAGWAGFIILVVSGILGVAALSIFSFEKFKAMRDAQPVWYLQEDEVQFLACSEGKRLTSFKELPSQKRTIRLRFLDLKSKVCRPFSA